MLRRTEATWEREQVDAVDLSGRTYNAYRTSGPGADSESAVIVSGDRYANVIVYGRQSLSLLAPSVASHLRR